MTKIVVGLLDSLDAAQNVVEDLARSGFDREMISLAVDEADVATPKAVGGGRPGGGVTDGLTRAGVPREHAAYYAEGVRRGSVLVTVLCEDLRARHASEIMDSHGAVDIDKRASEWQRREEAESGERRAETRTGGLSGKQQERAFGGAARTAREGLTPEREGVRPIVQEEVEIGKRRVDRGGVRVESRTHEEPVEEEVVLREERARIDRRQVDRPLSAAESEEAFRESTIDIPETAEEPVISKQARVREEIILGREEKERTEKIRESVRRTDVEIQDLQGRDEGFLDPDDADFKQHFQSYYARRGEDYRGFQEAYRYGATMSRYTSKDWRDVEADIHRDWDKEHPGTWGKFREAIHYGWEKTHRH